MGNTAGLFPTISPSPTPNFPREADASRVADSSALPEGASIVNAQLAGLAALALAFVLAVTRLSIRRTAKQSDGQPGPESRPDTEKPTVGPLTNRDSAEKAGLGTAYFASVSRLGRAASMVAASFALVIVGETTVPNVSLSNHTHIDALCPLWCVSVQAA